MSRINKPTAPLVPPTTDEDVEVIVAEAIASDDTHASLVNGEVPSDQLPSYVDDVLEFADAEHFPAEGEVGKIYVALNTNLTYRWSGSAYIQINNVDLSNYYTKGESDTLLGGKENTISDLDTIRSGAAAGATALQSVPSEYVTETELSNYHDSSKQDAINDLETIRSGAAAGATAVQPAAIANDIEIVEYQDQTPITEAQLAKAVAGKLAIHCNGRLYAKYYQSNAIINFHAFDIGHNISSSVTVTSTMQSKEWVILLNRETRMLSNSGYMPVSAIGDYADNFLEGSDEVAEEGKKLIREKDLYPVKELAESAVQPAGLEAKQDILVSGENIKTVNGESLLGEGNIEIQGGGTVDEYLIQGSINIRETLESIDPEMVERYIGESADNEVFVHDTLGRRYMFRNVDENSDVIIYDNLGGTQEALPASVYKVSVSIETDTEDPQVVWGSIDPAEDNYLYNTMGLMPSVNNRIAEMYKHVNAETGDLINSTFADFLDDIAQNGWQAKANVSDTYTKTEVVELLNDAFIYGDYDQDELHVLPTESILGNLYAISLGTYTDIVIYQADYVYRDIYNRVYRLFPDFDDSAVVHAVILDPQFGCIAEPGDPAEARGAVLYAKITVSCDPETGDVLSISNAELSSDKFDNVYNRLTNLYSTFEVNAETGDSTEIYGSFKDFLDDIEQNGWQGQGATVNEVQSMIDAAIGAALAASY